MNIDELTIGEVKQIQSIIGYGKNNNDIDFAIGEIVIVRTYSAGVWCGVLEKKSGNEVILKDARRLWRWWAAESISLSGVANYGIRREKSKIAPKVINVWLEAIEIIRMTALAKESIMGAEDAKAE